MSLSTLFSPRSIAVIGASSQPGTVGNDLVRNISAGFRGKLFPINIKGGELFGMHVFTSIREIKESIDLVIIAVPAPIVPKVLEEVGKKHIKVAIVVSSGFREVGNIEGEQQLVKIAKKYGITLIGPNCMGFMNPSLTLNATFAPSMPGEGSIAFLSQSGALGSAILDYAKSHNMGFSKFLSLGNKASVDENAALEYLAHDPDTKVILMYIEQLSGLSPILKTALRIRSARNPKPIIVLKSGQTPQGMSAAQSHTGALAGNDAFYDALFRQAGIIRANSIEELFILAECFTTNGPFPKDKDRVAVITNAGGLGVLVTDALVKAGMQLAQLTPATQEKLRVFLPPASSVRNPIDMLGDADALRYARTIKIVLEATTVDAVVILLTPQSMTQVEETARAITLLKRATQKPVIASFVGGDRIDTANEVFEEDHVSQFEFPEKVAPALGAMHQFSIWKHDAHKPKTFRDFDHRALKKLLHKKGWLSQNEVFTVLDACKIKTVRRLTIHLESQTAKAIRAVGGRAVLKIISPDILHKTDVGGVVINATLDNAEYAYRHLMAQVKQHAPHAKLHGVLVMEQVEQRSQELLIGAVRDEHLGALVGCGMGGVYTEAFADASFELVPISHTNISSMISRLRISTVLKAEREHKPYDIASLTDCIARVSYLIVKYPQIAELDVNPLFVLAVRKGVIAADARLRCA